jgi:uncharacterized repeat protein (TIGR01451 family)
MRVALAITCCIAAALLGASNASAETAEKETPAGTLAGRWIPSAASVRYSLLGETDTVETNNTLIQVAEIVAFNLNQLEEGKVGVKADEEYQFELEVTNIGNGTECFWTTPSDSEQGVLDITPVLLRSDSDDDGAFDFEDQQHKFSECTIWLAPGQTERLFIAGRMPRGVENDRAYFKITVGPSQGLGEIGTVYEDKGDGAADALSGTDPEEGYATFYAQGSTLRVGLQKTAVAGGDASRTDALPGEMIAYSLRFTGEGEGQVKGAIVSDPLPGTLSYVPGSLRLDGVLLSDAQDTDAGEFNAGALAVRLGDLIAPFDTTITFQTVVRATTQP